jgi:hypothetical protein
MSLVEKAKQKAEKISQEADKVKSAEAQFHNSLQKEVNAMSKKAIKALREFDQVKVSDGTLKLITGQKAKNSGTFERDRVAVLKLKDDTGATVDTNVLFIDCGVRSGTFDASDDCRDIPYTDSFLSIYSDEYRHSNISYSYKTRDFYESARNVEDVDKVLDKVAEYLAPLFRDK